MPAKMKSDATEALKQLTYLAAALKAPRITEAAARLADHARDAGWTHEEHLAASDPPGLPDWAEDRLLVLTSDSADRKIMGAAESARSSRGDPTVHQDQLEPVADTPPG